MYIKYFINKSVYVQTEWKLQLTNPVKNIKDFFIVKLIISFAKLLKKNYYSSKKKKKKTYR